MIALESKPFEKQTRHAATGHGACLEQEEAES
jgi:hypothetical protein